MSTFCKALATTAIAGTLVAFGGGSAQAADDQALFRCNGTIDFACYYGTYNTFCTLWINRCVIG